MIIKGRFVNVSEEGKSRDGKPSFKFELTQKEWDPTEKYCLKFICSDYASLDVIRNATQGDMLTVNFFPYTTDFKRKDGKVAIFYRAMSVAKCDESFDI